MIKLIYEDGKFSCLSEDVQIARQKTCDIEIQVKEQVEVSKKEWLLDEARKFINLHFGTSYQNIGIGTGINIETAHVDVITYINTRLH